MASLCADPQVVARGSVVRVEDPAMGAVLMPAPTPHLSRTPGRIGWSGRDEGADTDAVCRDWLGLPDASVAALRAAGALA